MGGDVPVENAVVNITPEDGTEFGFRRGVPGRDKASGNKAVAEEFTFVGAGAIETFPGKT